MKLSVKVRDHVHDVIVERQDGRYFVEIDGQSHEVDTHKLESNFYLFVTGDRLLANEFAPRVHNSGHWSIEGAEPSQFTAHLIAISNGQLETPSLRGYAGMLNLIGEIPEPARRLSNGTLHDYGKLARPGRKLGHITVIADTIEARERLLADISQIVTQSTGT